jgi:hypothetical protein
MTWLTGMKSFSTSNPSFAYRLGPMASEVELKRSVWPSGAARATDSAPMLPPAPARLMTTTGCFHSSLMRAASTRETGSTAPPAGNGTIMATCFSG